MTTIYLEPNVLVLETSGEAALQLQYLAESGADLVVVSDHHLPEWDSLGIASLRYESSPQEGARGDWWVTADPDDCAHRPLHGVRSILVGGALGGGGHTARCDVSARDLRSAVLEILSRQAMPDAAGTASAG